MEWFRAYHVISTDPKWRLVARMSKQPVAVVVAVWVSLLDHASQAEERGSVAGVDCDLLDVTLDLEDGVARAVVSAMESKGLVAEGRISAWDKRQVRREESDNPQAKTAAQRKREQRARDRARQDAESQGETQDNAGVTQCHTESHSVTNCHAPDTDTDTDTDTERDPDPEESTYCAAGAAPHAQKRPAGRKPTSILSGKRLETFEQFWDAYGYKRGRGGAEKAWAAIPVLTVSLVEQICAAARKEADRRPALEARGMTPKMAQGWLNERRWEDDYDTPQPQPQRPYVPQGRQGQYAGMTWDEIRREKNKQACLDATREYLAEKGIAMEEEEYGQADDEPWTVTVDE